MLIDTVPGSDSYRVVITHPDLKDPMPLTPGALVFGPSQTRLTGLASIAMLPDGTALVRMDGVTPAVLDDLPRADTLTMTIKSKVAATIAVPSPAKAVAALRQCNADQLVEWGADPAQFMPGGRIPVALKDRDDWIRNSDLIALLAGSGTSAVDALFRVAISATGSITDCRPVRDGIPQAMTKIACKSVMGKALFTPAQDPAGKPVNGAATFRARVIGRPA